MPQDQKRESERALLMLENENQFRYTCKAMMYCFSKIRGQIHGKKSVYSFLQIQKQLQECRNFISEVRSNHAIDKMLDSAEQELFGELIAMMESGAIRADGVEGIVLDPPKLQDISTTRYTCDNPECMSAEGTPVVMRVFYVHGITVRCPYWCPACGQHNYASITFREAQRIIESGKVHPLPVDFAALKSPAELKLQTTGDKTEVVAQRVETPNGLPTVEVRAKAKRQKWGKYPAQEPELPNPWKKS